MKKTKLIQSLDRGLQILDLMREYPWKRYMIKEIGEFLKIDPSSAFRLLTTLEERGYVTRSSGNAFSLGSTIYSLYGALASQLNLPSLMHEYLEKVTSVTGETSHLAIRLKDKAVFIDRVVGTEVISVNTDVGQSEPLHCTSVGKALICNMPTDLLSDLLEDKFKCFTPATCPTKNKLIKELDVIKKEGLAFDREEYQQGVMCLATPVYDGSEKVVCSIGVSGPVERIKKNLSSLTTLIKNTGIEAGICLGCNG